MKTTLLSQRNKKEYTNLPLRQKNANKPIIRFTSRKLCSLRDSDFIRTAFVVTGVPATKRLCNVHFPSDNDVPSPELVGLHYRLTHFPM